MIATLIVLALANAAIVITLTKSSLFEKFREWLPIINLKRLFHCPYCLSHWTSVILIICSPLFALTYFNIIMSMLALTTLTSIFAFVLLLYLNKLEETK